jgi:ABC-type transporter Mla subunit MlaD
MVDPVLQQHSEVRREESTAVSLARMEGKFDGLALRLADVLPVVAQHTAQIASLILGHQSLKDEAAARDKTVIATAQALKDAKDTAEGMDRTARAEADNSWSPVQRMGLIATAVGSIIVTAATVYGLTVH